MVTVEHEVGRYLTLLGNKIRGQGFTQLEVQEALGWGRSYISQLVTRQKALRLEQVLLILRVLGIEPAEFFDELYGGDRGTRAGSRAAPDPRAELAALRHEISGLAELLLEKGLIDADDLSTAVRAIESREDA